jgi:hypothetical protein
MRKFDIDEPERAWREGWTLERQRELVTGIRNAGYSDAIARVVAGWVNDLALDLPTVGARATERSERKRYRAILLELGPPKSPKKRRPRAPGDGTVTALKGRSQRGAADPRVIACLAVWGVVAAVCGLPWALVATPIILDDVDQAADELPVAA